MNTFIIVFSLIILLVIIRYVFRLARIRRFRIVKKGFYRGGQPSKLALWVLAKIFKVKTIINLREDHIESEAIYGMSETHILIPPRTNCPTREQVVQFLEIVKDETNYPLLVHCKVGANRTGIMLAFMRILHDDWSCDEAYAEMKKISGKTVENLLEDTLKELSAELKKEI